MDKSSSIVAASLVAVLGCWISAEKAEAEPLVFINSLHNLDYADEVCRGVLSMEPEARKTIRELANSQLVEPADWVKETVTAAAECRTVQDPRQLGRQLENTLTDALAVEPACGGVTVIRDPDRGFSQSNETIKQKKPFWNLHLDYRPASKVFGWALFPKEAGSKSSGDTIEGEGTAAKAANQICTVVTRRGATIR
jgi:hypothetical protein